MDEWRDADKFGWPVLRYVFALCAVAFGAVLGIFPPVSLLQAGEFSLGALVNFAVFYLFFLIPAIALLYIAYCLFRGWLKPLVITPEYVEFAPAGFLPRPAIRIGKEEITGVCYKEEVRGHLSGGTWVGGHNRRTMTMGRFPQIIFRIGVGEPGRERNYAAETVRFSEAMEALTKYGYSIGLQA